MSNKGSSISFPGGGGSGGGAPSFPLLAPDGTAGAPSYSFSTSPTSGWYLSTGLVTLSVAGVAFQTFQGTQVQIGSGTSYNWSAGAVGGGSDTGLSRAAAGIIKVTNGGAGDGILRAGNGALAAPTYSFSGNVGDGMYVRSSGVTLNFAVGGVYAGEFQVGGSGGTGNTGLILPSTGNFGWTNSTSIAAADTWLWRGAANVVFTNWIQNVGGEAALNANYTNATATFSNTNLSITVISGRTYNFEVNLFISESTAADGWQIDFNGGTAAMTNFVANAVSTAETGIIVVLANATSAALATVINATTTVTTGGQMIKIQGSFVPSGNGTFIVRAAQNTHSAGTLTIKRGSNLIARDTRAV